MWSAMAWGSLHSTQPLPDGFWVDGYCGYSQCVAVVGRLEVSVPSHAPCTHDKWTCQVMGVSPPLPVKLFSKLVAPINIATSSTWDPAGERHQHPVL